MVNSVFASRHSLAAPLVGGSIRGGGDVVYRVAGVVGDAREFALDREPTPTVYPCRLEYATPALSFLLRTHGDPSSIIETVRAKVKEHEPLRAVYDVAPLSERIGNEYTDDRLRTAALGLFAAAALSLACLGVYGTLSYVASLRRREVGLRVALGALQGHIVRQFLAKALRVVAISCAAGLVLALALSRSISGMLYGVSPMDPLTLTGVVTIVVVVAAFAAFLPALRAARVDPMDALREE
jgi:ABC-type lipoprotein release transport system permease subunit